MRLPSVDPAGTLGSCHVNRLTTSDPVELKQSGNEINRPRRAEVFDGRSTVGNDAGMTMTNGRKSGRPPFHLDDVSKAIIEQLQQDGRRSYAAIGKVVGLSEAAVRQRVQRLIEGGVMQVVAVTDPLEMGFARQAMVGVRVDGRLEPVADAIAALDEVDYVVVTAGSFDLLVEVVCESDEHLLDLLSSRIRTIEGVTGTETFMYLRLRKQTYSWGVR
jgi:Lrp/AsnC family transcriptional regulator for asnA, asnC and gidA